MEAPSTLSSAIAVACGVLTAIRASSLSMLREPRPTSPVVPQPTRTSVPHNTANTANRCGLITPPPNVWSKLARAELDRNRTRLIVGSKCGRAQGETGRLSSFSEGVARIQLESENKDASWAVPELERLVRWRTSVGPTRARSVHLANEIADGQAGERAHPDRERLFVDEEIRVVVWCRLGRILATRHDADVKKQARHLVSVEREGLRPAQRIDDMDVAVRRPLENRGHARRQARVVHQHIVELDDLDIGFGLCALGNLFGDALDADVHALAHVGIVGANGAGHLDEFRHDVEARPAMERRDADDGRRLHQVGATAHDGLDAGRLRSGIPG